jgi:hypothetical protein
MMPNRRQLDLARRIWRNKTIKIINNNKIIINLNDLDSCSKQVLMHSCPSSSHARSIVLCGVVTIPVSMATAPRIELIPFDQT